MGRGGGGDETTEGCVPIEAEGKEFRKLMD